MVPSISIRSCGGVTYNANQLAFPFPFPFPPIITTTEHCLSDFGNVVKLPDSSLGLLWNDIRTLPPPRRYATLESSLPLQLLATAPTTLSLL